MEAYYMQRHGFHLATTIDYESSYPASRKHFALMVVDDDGKIVMS